MKKKTPSRFFRNINGFDCGTRALEWDGKRMWMHPATSLRRQEAYCYNLDDCLGYVSEGAWEELSVVPKIKNKYSKKK